MTRTQELLDVCDDGRDVVARLRGDQDDPDGSEKLRAQDFSFSREKGRTTRSSWS